MTFFEHSAFDGHEKVSFFHDKATGLQAIIALHNTTLGPALGGCRMWAYDSDEKALEDVLRLSRGMTYKAAVAGLPLGGGKSVIIGDSRTLKTPELMQAMGRAVESLGGRYIIAEDVGTSVADMQEIRKSTKFVTGLPAKDGGHVGGDPSPVTAYGVYVGLKQTAKEKLGTDNLSGVRIAVQGLGNVGYNLAKLLHADGAVLFVTDVNQERVQDAVRNFGATAVGLDDIYAQDVDIFAPCALGAILNDATIPMLKAKLVAGAANNQLAKARHGDMLKDRGILYAPDYVINAGGLINVFYEQQAEKSGSSFSVDEVKTHVAKIGSTLDQIFKMADADGLATSDAADFFAESRFNPQNGNAPRKNGKDKRNAA